jgi:hypothetical protein
MNKNQNDNYDKNNRNSYTTGFQHRSWHAKYQWVVIIKLVQNFCDNEFERWKLNNVKLGISLLGLCNQNGRN